MTVLQGQRRLLGSRGNCGPSVRSRPGSHNGYQRPHRLASRVSAAISTSAAEAGSSSADLEDGKVVDGPDLTVKHFSGLTLPNPFVIGSGPPGTNYAVMKKAFDEGWGAVIAKTVSLDCSKVINVTPRYAKLRCQKEVIGWENIELISDRPLETMLDEFKRLKAEYPGRILIASIMEEYNRGAWEELIERCEEAGVDAFEINFSCPHGMPERKMGMAMGQDCQLLEEVCGWINAKATKPVWAKMTPNITDIAYPARTALAAGCEGVAAINTITSVMGINLDTLRPEPSVEGYTTPGGYSSRAVKPIALAKVMSIAQLIRSEYDNSRDLSGIGGIETGQDAAEFLLLGANSVQVCTGVMLHGYPLVKQLCGGLQQFMSNHGFNSIEDFRGASLPYFTSHHELVRMQKEAIAAKKAARVGLSGDDKWSGDGFVKEAESMVAN
ncbi:Dihydropyrimidine dehydrogenase [NADP(+)] [Coccomyxa viridis]|uniref:dihydropyrimidine dehydrogenase (NADP(+)) n=1 Tax=Coccomyxa viridis TaxID=1274662 RepID=A0AAV1I261_9CHLO|nr:Dihydropyrimidine dehydrogenase [NADP(+)] [Coccomyxa viridis]